MARKGQNRGLFRVARDMDGEGLATGRWEWWQAVPDWFSWENQGAGVAVADLAGNGKQDLVVFGIDAPPGQNQAFFRVANDIDAEGRPTAGWSSLLGVNNWFSWENQYPGITVIEGPDGPQLLILAVDHPVGGNAGVYTAVRLREDPAVHGTWETLKYDSEVLAVHAARLHTREVLFFAGSGNNPVRAQDPTFGDVTKGMFTSVVWDPEVPQGQFFHPDTHRRAGNEIFDFFCGGDTFLADGSLLSAGGNKSYGVNGNNLGQRDVAAFDPTTRQWSARASMARGRWYPTLLSLADGRVLAVSGKDGNGVPNPDIEVYDPAADSWTICPPLNSPDFIGLPFYAHLFLLQDERVSFSGGRMDDERPQGPSLLDFRGPQPTFRPVRAAAEDEGMRNQSSSVLLPPAQNQTVMIIGGGPREDITSATGHTEAVRLDVPEPRYRPMMPLSLPRMHLNAVLLPDRTVFVSGGAIKHEEGGSHRSPGSNRRSTTPPRTPGARERWPRSSGCTTRWPCCCPTAGWSRRVGTPHPTVTWRRGSLPSPTRSSASRFSNSAGES